MSDSTSDTQSTVHYAKPTPRTPPTPGRAAHIRYPTVVVAPQDLPSVSYAIPFANEQYSTSRLEQDHFKHKFRMAEEENQRLLSVQTKVVQESNRRVEMHLNEIRLLKEENRRLNHGNKQLRDLCCYLDDDRQKTKKLAHEWQKFGTYTSRLMKKEIHAYHKRQSDLEEKLTAKEEEVEELKKLCLYLDEQRQAILTAHQNEMTGRRMSDDISDDLGCGSSEDEKDYDQTQESTLRRISEQMHTSVTSSVVAEERKEEAKKETTRLLGYIQSLESRIQHLELSQPKEGWSNGGSDYDENTIIERWNSATEKSKEDLLNTSQQSGMSWSGTTYASSNEGDSHDLEEGSHVLEIRTLPTIDEEMSEKRTIEVDSSADLPPMIAPISSSLLSVANLMKSASDSMAYNHVMTCSAKTGVTKPEWSNDTFIADCIEF